ncbi:MAG: hypothetical protein ACRD59_16090 [Candidatus Acidiferrales bacterium]
MSAPPEAGGNSYGDFKFEISDFRRGKGKRAGKDAGPPVGGAASGTKGNGEGDLKVQMRQTATATTTATARARQRQQQQQQQQQQRHNSKGSWDHSSNSNSARLKCTVP